MASALCTTCLAEFHWEARRGMRLAQVVSPCCGAPGRAFRYAARPSAYVIVERLGSLEEPSRWTWTGQRLTVALLANGNIQLENRAIYAPVYCSGDALYFRYAGRDPYCTAYRLRMAARDYQALTEKGAIAA